MPSVSNKESLMPPDVSERLGSDAKPSLKQVQELDPFFRTSARDPQTAENARRALCGHIETAMARPVETAMMLSHAFAIDVRLAQRILALEKQVAELLALFAPPTNS